MNQICDHFIIQENASLALSINDDMGLVLPQGDANNLSGPAWMKRKWSFMLEAIKKWEMKQPFHYDHSLQSSSNFGGGVSNAFHSSRSRDHDYLWRRRGNAVSQSVSQSLGEQPACFQPTKSNVSEYSDHRWLIAQLRWSVWHSLSPVSHHPTSSKRCRMVDLVFFQGTT